MGIRGYMTEKAAAELEEEFKLKRRAVEILDLVVSEWESDPVSVQCFDLRLVAEAKKVVKRIKELNQNEGS